MINKNEIIAVYGKDIVNMTIQLAKEADLKSLIACCNKKIGLKPNLVLASPASEGATTHSEIAEGLIIYLKENGFNNIVILEGAWAGGNTKEAFRVCGYQKLAEMYGVKLIDTKLDKGKMLDCKGIKLEICESALSIDFMINLPVLKGHCQTKITCALKNNKGLIPDGEKRRFHSLGLTRPIAHLNTVIQNDFILADNICGDLDFEEGGNPLYAGRLFCAIDPVLCDAWAAKQIGYSPYDIPYIALAEKLEIGSADLDSAIVRELNREDRAKAETKASGKIKRFTPFIAEDKACSVCYASLIHALSRAERLNFQDKICIGQGFKGKTGNIGAGNCCSKFKKFSPGCPPSAKDILASLQG